MAWWPGEQRRQWRDADAPDPAPARSLGVWVVGTVLAVWAGLLLNALRSGDEGHGQALMAVTATAAAACWARTLQTDPDRLVWGLFATGLTGYALGYVVLFEVSTGEGAGPGGLNLSDCFSLAFYPACAGALVILTTRRVLAVDPRALLDGTVVALATGAATIVASHELDPMIYGRGPLEALYAAAYPVGTVMLAVLTVCGLVVVRFRVDRVWTLLLLAFVVMSVGQVLYALRSADGSFRFGTWLDAVYTAGPVLVAVAAWTRPSRAAAPRSTSSSTVMGLTAAATLGCLLVLVVDEPTQPAIADWLAAAGIVAAVVRTVLFVRQDHLLDVRTHQALTDPLTDLPNRRALLDLLESTVAQGGEAVLLLMDLDRFKNVNDTLGHSAGDLLLRQVATRLSTTCPEGAVLARLGGDEFAVLVTADPATSLALAEQLRSVLEEPITLLGHRLAISGSVGLATTADLPDEGAPTSLATGASELLRRADVALYGAKKLAGGVALWEPASDDAAQALLTLVSDLRGALVSTDQIVVHLQPQCDLAAGHRPLAMEALVRWQHPQLGMLWPDRFLGAASDAGLLSKITDVVLEQSLLAIAAMSRDGHRIPVSVNLAASDLQDPRFASRVAQALDRHRVAPELLRLEVTETVVMQDSARAIRTLSLLRGIGVGISLDDYGTGLSSLAYLRQLPVDELKIDRSFVANMLADRTNRLIVRSTIDLAHGLGLTVVAEGVEDAETVAALADMGCDLVQGYLTGRPSALADLALHPPQEVVVA